MGILCSENIVEKFWQCFEEATLEFVIHFNDYYRFKPKIMYISPKYNQVWNIVKINLW